MKKNHGRIVDETCGTQVEKNSDGPEAELLRLDAEISRAVRALDHWLFRLRCGAGDDREGSA